MFKVGFKKQSGIFDKMKNKAVNLLKTKMKSILSDKSNVDKIMDQAKKMDNDPLAKKIFKKSKTVAK